MPRFRRRDSTIYRVSLPRPTEKDPEINLNPDEDVKITLTFAENKLVVPNIKIFDSQRKSSLEKLIVIFYHDDFDVLRLSYHTEMGHPIQRFDATHPSLTAFELEYQWEAVQEDDLRLDTVCTLDECTNRVINLTLSTKLCILQAWHSDNVCKHACIIRLPSGIRRLYVRSRSRRWSHRKS
jgi:hypothetical protein